MQKERAYGPYLDKGRWRVVVKRGRTIVARQSFASEKDAADCIDKFRAKLEKAQQTLEDALVVYEEYLRETLTDHGRKTVTRGLSRMFPDTRISLSVVDQQTAQELYDEMRRRPCPRTGRTPAVATQQVSLRVTRSFWKWMKRRGMVESNPWTEIEAVGRCKRGKPQLTIDESRKLVATCLASDRTDATAVLVCLLLGLRSAEVAAIDSRCLDDGGRLLRVPGTKTEAALRIVEVPEVLRDRLAAFAAEPGWTTFRVYHAVPRWCARAGVSRVSPHGLRGTHASLATSAGATGALVAAQLGHASEAVTKAHYSQPGAVATGSAKTAMRVLSGGR